jgi:UDP-galactopyranose mutase
MSPPATLILGGGLAGLSAAYHLDGQAALYERHPSLGGLCSQVRVDGFRFDAVPHVLHFRRDDIRALVERLLDGHLVRYARQARIASHGTTIRYPFQAHLFGLPASVISECLQGRLDAAQEGDVDTSTFERWVVSTFGSGIAKHFLVPY